MVARRWLGAWGLGLLVGLFGSGCAAAEEDAESDDSEVVAGDGKDELVSQVDYAAKATRAPATPWNSETSFADAAGKAFDPAKYASTVFDKFGRGAKVVEIAGTPHQEYK